MTSRKILFSYILLALFCLLLASGCVSTTGRGKWKPLHNKKTSLVHTVQWPEETLSMVAEWYTGYAKRWKLIANANPNIVPGQLSVGDRVFVEVSLLKRRSPMTRSFVEKFSAPLESSAKKAAPRQRPTRKISSSGKFKKKALPSPKPAPRPAAVTPDPEEEEFQLFGPQ